MERGLRLHKGQAFLNSLSGESEKIKALIPLLLEHKPRIIALCLNDKGIPETSDKALFIAQNIVEFLIKKGIKTKDIFIDPLVRPISVDQNAALLFLESLEKIKKSLPEVKTIGGISNVSFGLPQRRLLNRAFLVLALQKGLDAAILDPLDRKLQLDIFAAKALFGNDPSLKNYLTYVNQY
jgi:5-methyltetrahydrofolate--homocysteine methyltransferase